MTNCNVKNMLIRQLKLCRDRPELFNKLILKRAPYWSRQMDLCRSIVDRARLASPGLQHHQRGAIVGAACRASPGRIKTERLSLPIITIATIFQGTPVIGKCMR